MSKKNIKFLTLFAVPSIAIAALFLFNQKSIEKESYLVSGVKKTPDASTTEKRSQPQTEEKTSGLFSGKNHAIKYKLTPKKFMAFKYSIIANNKIDFAQMLAGLNSPNKSTKRNFEKIVSIFKGKMTLKVYKKDENAYYIAGQIFPTKNIIGRQKAELHFLATKPFLFKMDFSGNITKIQLRKGADKSTLKFVERIIRSMEVILPATRQKTWNVNGKDSLGTFNATYAVRSDWDSTVKVNRVKHKYITSESLSAPKSISNKKSKKSKLEQRVISSQMNAELNLDQSWITKLYLQEIIQTTLNNKLISQGDVKANYTAIKEVPLHTIPATLKDLMGELNDTTYLASLPYQPKNNTSNHTSLVQALEAYLKLNRGNSRAAYEDIMDFLRLHPQASYELVEILEQADRDGENSNIKTIQKTKLWHLLALVGHAEAQDALLKAFENQNLLHYSRVSALTALFSLQTPSVKTSQRLLEMHDSLAHFDEPTEGILHSTSLFAYGAMGNPKRKNEEVKKITSEVLIDKILSTDDPIYKRQIITAIGNHGGSNLLESIESVIQDDSEQVRGAAFKALRHMGTQEARNTLMVYYEEETSINVKLYALKALNVMPVHDDLVKWSVDQLNSPISASEQVGFINYVGSSATNNPAVESTLRKLAKKPIDVKIKQEIYKYIAP